MNSMLTVYNQQPSCSAKATQDKQFLSRIFTDAVGRRFRLTFLVAMVGGELKGHLVSAEPISSSAPTNRQVTGAVCENQTSFCLPIFSSDKKPTTAYIPAFAPVVSPYFSLEFLINSQPTRAPAVR